MMSQRERYEVRDASYSAWHRADSTKRFIPLADATRLSMIDLDGAVWVEYADATREPVAILEAARDVGQDTKPATVCRRLAEMAGIEAWVVLYSLAEIMNPADTNCHDISGFRVMRIHPPWDKGWVPCSPKQWCKKLMSMRTA